MATDVSNPESIVVGDIVYLKSGSPKMTVNQIDEKNATCNWFEENTSKSQVFSTLALTKINPNKLLDAYSL